MHAWFAAFADTRYSVVAPIVGVQVMSPANLSNRNVSNVENTAKSLQNMTRVLDGL